MVHELVNKVDIAITCPMTDEPCLPSCPIQNAVAIWAIRSRGRGFTQRELNQRAEQMDRSIYARKIGNTCREK